MIGFVSHPAFLTISTISQRIDLTALLQDYILSTLLLVNCVLINLKGARRRETRTWIDCRIFFEGLLFDWQALNRTATQVFGRVSWKGQWLFDDILLWWRKKGLTALVALDHNVFDGQQTSLPWGYGFKHNLRKRKESYNTDDKWPHLQMTPEWGCLCA